MAELVSTRWDFQGTLALHHELGARLHPPRPLLGLSTLQCPACSCLQAFGWATCPHRLTLAVKRVLLCSVKRNLDRCGHHFSYSRASTWVPRSIWHEVHCRLLPATGIMPRLSGDSDKTSRTEDILAFAPHARGVCASGVR